MKKLKTFLLSVLSASFCYSQTAVELQPSQLASLGFHTGYNSANTNYDNVAQFAAFCIPGFNTGVNSNRGLIQFDFSGIPAGSTIISASLHLYKIPAIGFLVDHTIGNNESYMQRVTASWNQSTVTWNNAPAATSTGQAVLAASVVGNQNYDVDLTSLVQYHLDNPASNFGYLFRLANETPTRVMMFASDVNSDISLRPTLSVVYCPPVQVLTVSASGPTSFCEGGSVELSVNTDADILWNDGETGNPRIVSSSGAFSLQSTGTCPIASNSIEVHVWSNPDVPTINPSGIVNIDQGSSVMLMSSPAVSFEWIPGGQTTQSINVNSSGAYSVRVFNEHGCSAVSSATTVNVNPVIEPPVPGTCTAVEVIEYLPAKQNDGTNLPASRMISTNALGAPQNSDLTTGEANYNFVSLGFGGSITVRMSGAIANGDGNDIRVTETTFGSMSGNCVRYPETILAFASQDNCNWVYLGSGCQDAEFDLGELNWAEYIRLVDVSPLSSNYNGGIADGYDVDGIVCLHGTIDNPEMQDLGNSYAMSYVSSAQGPRKNGTPVAASRSDENQALGAPQNTNTVNFFSLGFGGNIVLKLGYAIFDKPGADIEVVETSYGNPACASYREEAMVEVSLDGSNWIDLGIICLDGSVDLSTGGAIAASYVRITDHSAASNFGSTGDAYDLDGIIVLQPGCSASNPTAQKLEDITSPNEIANIDLVQSVTKNNFNMNISVEKPEVMNIIVTSLMGQQISARSLEVNGYAVQNIDLAGLSAGVYLISARSASVNETFKVFVK
ncbi:MAG: DNRLRE domain-containing protein [Bacteroidetes bacterium]|nr:DNRLRE domain-containing protein [Bacteroidota bacterium]